MRDPAPVTQQEMQAFLQDASAYPHDPDHVRLVQTHASYVALVPPLAYKVKKPVNFGFLDFSSLEKRRHYCEEEVRLNRRLCPNMYEDVVTITRKGNDLFFGGDGEVVEYAVRMRYLEDGYFLHQMVGRGNITLRHLDRVVHKLTAFYEAETSSPEIAEWGRIERLRLSTDENFDQTTDIVGALLSHPAYEALYYYTERFYDEHARLLNRRRTGGHILDCHGDLHLEHVHITPERVCIYDCIEFNERFRYIDVANDLAFLAMDLDFNGRRDLSKYFVQQITASLRDTDLALLTDFYKCYRAYVRGKVESFRCMDHAIPESERAESRDRSVRYFQLALQYAIAGSSPLVVVVMGRVGSGKSTQARALGRALGWPVFSSDEVRKTAAGVPLYERGDAAARALLYSREQTEQTYATLLEQALDRARQGEGSILDATFGSRHHREELRAALHEAGVPYVFVEIEAPEETRRARLERRTNADGIVSDARIEDFDMLDARYDPPDALEETLHVRIATKSSKEDTTLETLKALIRLGP